jgi:hypothetical protein
LVVALWDMGAESAVDSGVGLDSAADLGVQRGLGAAALLVRVLVAVDLPARLVGNILE